MPQSLSLVIVHLVFSTNDRLPRFDAPLRRHYHPNRLSQFRHPRMNMM